MAIMASLLVKNVKKVQITERIFPKGLINPFKLLKFSNYKDSNYGKEIIRVS